ncbi:hypothetical protein M2A_3280 [Tepidicaulis marinus]|uniref:Uncharacterized protein n=1 Tax=Tepidicaulis marinus TaxID=1333998 RepID=A0A081BFG3_9HYPH|nr:hypothetical protein M2A_3280 [Tepidicaulis marinus]
MSWRGNSHQVATRQQKPHKVFELLGCVKTPFKLSKEISRVLNNVALRFILQMSEIELQEIL